MSEVNILRDRRLTQNSFSVGGTDITTIQQIASEAANEARTDVATIKQIAEAEAIARAKPDFSAKTLAGLKITWYDKEADSELWLAGSTVYFSAADVDRPGLWKTAVVSNSRFLPTLRGSKFRFRLDNAVGVDAEGRAFDLRSGVFEFGGSVKFTGIFVGIRKISVRLIATCDWGTGNYTEMAQIWSAELVGTSDTATSINQKRMGVNPQPLLEYVIGKTGIPLQHWRIYFGVALTQNSGEILGVSGDFWLKRIEPLTPTTPVVPLQILGFGSPNWENGQGLPPGAVPWVVFDAKNK